MVRFYFLLLSTLLCVFLFLSCEEEMANPDEIVFPERNVSYGKHVEPLFFRTCTFSECHSSETKAGNLSLETYQEAMAAPGVIIPRDPDNSRLIRRVEGRDGLERMPRNLPRLTDNHIQGLRRWILEGAQNN